MALLQAAVEAISGLQTEIAIFLVALVAHATLFGIRRVQLFPGKTKRSPGPGLPGGSKESPFSSSPSPTVAALLRVAKQLVRQGASSQTIAQKFEESLCESTPEGVGDALLSMLECMGRGANAEILAATRQVVRQRGLQLKPRLAELLLKGFLALRSQGDFKELLAEVETCMDITPGMAVLALRASLGSSDLEAALGYLKILAPQMKAQAAAATPSAAPQQLLQQLVQLAVQQTAVPLLLQRMRDDGLFAAWTLEVVLTECAKRQESAGLQQAEALARSQGVGFTDAAYAALVRGVATADEALKLFREAAGLRLVGKGLLTAAAGRAAAEGHADLAKAVVKNFRAGPTLEVAATLVRMSAEGPLAGADADTSVLQLFEEQLGGLDLLADAHAGRLVVEAALRRRQPEALAQLMRAAPEGSRQVQRLLKSLGSERRLADAMEVFQACPAKPACLYNALLEACTDCQDSQASERVMAEAVAAGAADVVTYNTMIKRHLQHGDFKRARAAIEAMREAGSSLAPNSVTFNEFIDAVIRTGGSGVWMLVEEMKASGVQPNSVTCSILMKSVQRSSSPGDVERVMAFVDSMDDAMDEVLLSSVCEACIRVGRTDLLRERLNRQRSSKGVPLVGAHTFGSLVRSYGFLNDMAGAWETWREMRRQGIVPTSITIGCMVEALVSNGDPEGGYELIQRLREDEETRGLLNAVIYCSVLKGFTHQKRYERSWAVYTEMVEERLQFSIVTFNAVIDACARSGQMTRVPKLLKEMAAQKIEANVVTYSTIIKGHCQENRLDKAFELLENMKKSECFRPDEITYNTLIDGCAQRGMYDAGVKLLKEMQEAGVPPSSFTLSVVVKLATRSRRPEKAFELCDQLARKYRLKLNVQVYNNLLHACTTSGDMGRAMHVCQQMLQEKVRPDARTYTLLARGYLSTGEAKDAAGLLRAAVGLKASHPALAGFAPAALRPSGPLLPELISEVLEALMGQVGLESEALELLRDLRTVPGIRLDPKLQLTLTKRAMDNRNQR